MSLATELYIHFYKQDYLSYREDKKMVENVINWAELAKIYTDDANTLKNRMGELLSITNKDGETLASALGVINDLTTGNTLSQIEQKMVKTIPDQIRQGINRAAELKSIINSSDVAQQISTLDNFLQHVHKITDNFNQNNEDFLQYILQQSQNSQTVESNINSLFSNGDNLNLLQINSTAMTSFKSLSEAVKALDQLKTTLQNGGDMSGTVTYKNQTVSYKSIIYSLHQLFINILGGLGEGVAAAFALKIIDEWLQSLESENIKVTLEGTGTQKNEDGQTNKGDYQIIVNSEDGSINFHFGISVKAQNLQKSKKKTTTFQESKLLVYMNALTVQEKYLFYNSLYHNIDTTRGKINHFLRRKIAAQNFLHAVTGGTAENVLFLQYLDAIIRVDEYFEQLAAAATTGNVPGISITGVKSVKKSDYINKRGVQSTSALQSDNYIDVTPEEKNVLAWQRSKTVVNAFNNLATKISWSH